MLPSISSISSVVVLVADVSAILLVIVSSIFRSGKLIISLCQNKLCNSEVGSQNWKYICMFYMKKGRWRKALFAFLLFFIFLHSPKNSIEQRRLIFSFFFIMKYLVFTLLPALLKKKKRGKKQVLSFKCLVGLQLLSFQSGFL